MPTFVKDRDDMTVKYTADGFQDPRLFCYDW